MTSSVSGELMQVREGAEGPRRRGSGRRGVKGTEKEAGLFVRSRERQRRGLHGSTRGGESERVGFRETQRTGHERRAVSVELCSYFPSTHPMTSAAM